jgi:hypothetical protein
MANIFNYKSMADYLSATDRPTFQSSMSYDGDEAHIDGVNVLLPFKQGNCAVGDKIVYDSVDGCLKVLKWRTYNAGTFDRPRYVDSTGIFGFDLCGKPVIIAEKSPGTFPWAAKCYFRLTGFDLTAAGSLTFKTYYSWAAHAGNVVSWDAGATLVDIAAKFNTLGLNASYFKAATLADGTGIGVWVNYPTVTDVDTILSITEQTGAVEREYMQLIDGKPYVPQYVDTSTIIPGRLGPRSVLRKNGLMTPWGGGHPERFYNSCSVNGSATFLTEANSTPMRKEMFESLAEASDEAQKALYDKYGGDYAAYLDGAMVLLDAPRGVMAEGYDDFVVQTRLLAEVMTVDYDRKPIPAFPAAYEAFHYGVAAGVSTSFERGNWGMLGGYGGEKLILALGVDASHKSEFNKALDKFNPGGNFYAGNYSWLSAEGSAGYAYCYNGYGGSFDYGGRYDRLSVRPALALTYDL